MAVRLLLAETDSFAMRRLAIAVLLMLAGSLLAAATPVIFKAVLDAFGAVHKDSLSFGLPLLMIAYVLSLWLARCLNELRWLVHGRAEQRFIRRLSGRVFAHLLALPLRFHLDQKTGALSRTFANGILGYRILLDHTVFSVLPAVVQLAAMGAILGHLYRPAFLLILGLAIIAYLTAFGIGTSRISEPVRSLSAAEIDASGIMTDGLLSLETIKCFTAERRIVARLDSAMARGESHWVRFHHRRAALGLSVATIFALSLGSTLIVASGEVTRGTITVGDFVLVNAYILQIVAPLETLGIAFRDLAQGMAFIERLLGLVAEVPEDLPVRRALPQGGAGELVFEHVSFSYRPGQPVLTDVSFRIPARKTVAIVGESGSGKSTLVRLLVRLVEADEGRILLDDMPITDLSPASLREAIAVVPQDTVLLNDTIAGNIAIAAPASTEKEIARAARLARIHDLITGLPLGYRTLVGERGLKLSAGERQRIAIARAALAQPRIWVFDEATSALDAMTEREILVRLPGITQGATTLLISHRLPAVMHADEILVLRHGAIAERGRHADLLNREGAYAALWRAYHGATPRTVYRGADGR